MKDFQKRNLKISGALLIAGLLYYAFIRLTGFYVPCIFRLITGLKCPGCGVSTMCVALLQLDFEGAYTANPFLLITSPFVAFEIIYTFFVAGPDTLQRGRFHRVNNILLYIYAALLIIWGIYRNIM